VSIWASHWDVDASDHANDCTVWVEIDRDTREWDMANWDGRKWRRDLDRGCSCRCGPLAYHGSHIMPTVDGERGGDFGMCEIPGFVRRDIPDDVDEDSYPPHPFLRVCLVPVEDAGPFVVLDRAQVKGLHEYLTDWLARTEPT